MYGELLFLKEGGKEEEEEEEKGNKAKNKK
jgi:hypothetical protein